jgi:hypothetical protein
MPLKSSNNDPPTRRNVQWLRSIGAESESEAERILQSVTIGLLVDERAKDRNVQICAEFAANLLARMFWKFTIPVAEHGGQAQIAKSMKSEILKIRPEAAVSSGKVADCWLCIGCKPRSDLTGATLSVDASSWMVYFSSENPSGIRGERIYNPLSAAAAACIWASEVFKTVFKGKIPNSHPSGNFTLNLLDYSVNGIPSTNVFPANVDIGECHLVGAGAIGHGFLYALSKMPDLKGTLHIVENRDLHSGHLQRYVLTNPSNINGSKIGICQNALAGIGGIEVKTHKMSFNEYAARERHDFKFNLVISAVDSGQTRKEIQAKLPKLIINGWTREAEFGVTKHDFISEDACLMCLYLNTEKIDENKMIGDALGLNSGHVEEMRRKNTPIKRDHIFHIAKQLGINQRELESYKGQSIEAVYRDLICARAPMEIHHQNFFVPAAYLSAIAGLFIAVELVKEKSAELKSVMQPTTYIRYNTLVDPYLLTQKRLKIGNCICGDDDYRAAYLEKYGLMAS